MCTLPAVCALTTARRVHAARSNENALKHLPASLADLSVSVNHMEKPQQLLQIKYKREACADTLLSNTEELRPQT